MFEKHLAVYGFEFSVERINIICKVYAKNMIDFLQFKEHSLYGVPPFFIHTTTSHRSIPIETPNSEKLLVSELGSVELTEIEVRWHQFGAKINFKSVSCDLSPDLRFSNFTKN